MFNRIKDVITLPKHKLNVLFIDGTTKQYDVTPLFNKIPTFQQLKDEGLFNSAKVDVGGYGIVWNDNLDLSCDELWENGAIVETPFDDLMSFAEASELWGLSESALRKAISYGKIIPGVDARKFGKQWIVAKQAMIREYGEPTAA